MVAPLFLAAILPIQTPTPTTNPNDLADRHARNFLLQEHPAALSVAVMHNGKLLFAQGYGLADRAQAKPATRDTIYRLASVSKPVTAVLVARLAGQGKLDLDADIRQYVPEFPEKPHPVTLRQILSHTSGIRHYIPNRPDNSPVPSPSTAQALAKFSTDPLLFTPGERVSYSTHAFTLAARAIETATSQRFEQALQTHVSRPLRTPSLTVENLRRPNPRRAALYRRANGQTLPAGTPEDNYWKAAGGGMEASAPDLARFGDAVLRHTLLTPPQRAELWQRPLVNNRLSRNALGWVRIEGNLVGHIGSQQGSSTMLLLDPRNYLTIAVLSNTSGIPIPVLARQIHTAYIFAAGTPRPQPSQKKENPRRAQGFSINRP